MSSCRRHSQQFLPPTAIIRRETIAETGRGSHLAPLVSPISTGAGLPIGSLLAMIFSTARIANLPPGNPGMRECCASSKHLVPEASPLSRQHLEVSCSHQQDDWPTTPRQPPDAQISSFAATKGSVMKSLEQTGTAGYTLMKMSNTPKLKRRSQPIGWSATYTGAQGFA